MNPHKTQLERVRTKLHRDGRISRNDCVRVFPAILRLSARIQELEELGYAFDARKVGGDYCYRLVSIKGVPFTRELISTV